MGHVVDPLGHSQRGSRTAVVVGAGIVGASCAYYLVGRGLRTIVVDSGGIAQGATGLASGGVRAQFRWALETAMTLRSRQLWQRFEADHGVDLGYRQVGYLSLAATDEFAAEMRRRLPVQRKLGVQIEELDAAAVSELLPGVRTDDLVTAMLTPLDGFGSPNDVTTDIASAAKSLGAQFRLHEAVSGIDISGGVVLAVRTANGDRIPCDLVINAAGLGAGAIGAMVDQYLPVTPYRQHQFLTEDLPDLDTVKLPNVLDPSLDLYLRGEGRGVLLGIASDAEAGRSDTAVTWALLEQLGEALDRRWPRLATAGIAHGWVGCYEVTPDRRAMIGAARDADGFYYATGFSGHGFMHGLAAAEAVVTLAVDGAWGHLDLTELSAERFAQGLS